MRTGWGIVLLCCIACDGGSDQEAETDGPATSSTSSTSSTTSGSSSSSSGDSAPGYAPQVPMCRKQCDFAADCCPADLDDCPNLEFPGNFGCVDGLCVPAPCESDAQCEAVEPGTTCHDVDGVPQCIVICDGDDACASLGTGFACGGQSSDGQGFCRERCDTGTPCLLEVCNPEGICECSSDDECINGFACDVNAGA